MTRELNRRELPNGDFIVVYDWMEVPNGQNLVRLSPDGSVLWRASLPTVEDCFVGLYECNPETVIAQSWSGYRCTIDAKTGKIIHQLFTK